MWAKYLANVLRADRLSATTAELPKASQIVKVLTLLRKERLWSGAAPPSLKLIPNKPMLAYGGQPAWAEFVLLRLLESDGWRGSWVKNWGGRAFWRDPGEVTELPEAQASLFRRIEVRAPGRGGGCWDIFAWRGDDVLFIESKQRGKDRLRLTQRTWLESALAEGIPLASFAIVEWQARL